MQMILFELRFSAGESPLNAVTALPPAERERGRGSVAYLPEVVEFYSIQSPFAGVRPATSTAATTTLVSAAAAASAAASAAAGTVPEGHRTPNKPTTALRAYIHENSITYALGFA